METTLLCSCLAFPKVAFALRSSPPSYIKGATEVFDLTMREALSELAGGPLQDWAWMKASLPSSFDGLNIGQASLHAPDAFLGSLDRSSFLITRILGYVTKVSSHVASSVAALAKTAW